ncbi:MAG TPA: SpoIIE family protein phosphatase [Pirellulales bacterium]|jgi:serine phosphatase RsbU (regulator of sigma subunit)/pSer/pThr/pTyr-binding forkhead associated (FHA) protein
MAVLQVLKGMAPGQQFPLEAEKAVLGRHPDCDIVLDIGAVSRQHAQILQIEADYYLEDLKSRNGTYVNGQQIHDRRRLEDNDRIKICDLLFTFRREQPQRQSGTIDGALGLSAELVDDAGASAGSTVMSKLDLSKKEPGRYTVNAEAKLKAILEINDNLGSAISVDQVLPKILDSLFKVFLQADRGFIVLQENDKAPLIPKAVKHRRADAEEMIRISRTIVSQVMQSKEAILSADAASDSRFDSSQSIADFRIRSMMCAPLLNSTGKALGAIQIDTLDQRSRFQQEDLDVLANVAGQAGRALENAQLHDAAMRQHAFERDLQLAHKVQQGFLPSAPPKVEGYDFFDFYEPANQVGGDYFDYVPLSGGRLAMILADVSGKGISAALLTAKLSSEARYCLASEPTPAGAMNRLNAAFSASGWEDRFVTIVIAVLDPNKHEVCLVNGGHMAPFLRHADGRVEEVGSDAAGVPLGVAGDYEYQQFEMVLKPSESLTLFTDGFSEAMNANNDLYGLARLHDHLATAAKGVQQQGAILLADVKSFVGDRAQSDDMCLICFGRQ